MIIDLRVSIEVWNATKSENELLESQNVSILRIFCGPSGKWAKVRIGLKRPLEGDHKAYEKLKK